MKFKQTHPLIIGTFILTATGLITRIIGFFYRIYLSRLFGEEGMGIYQLLSPILSLTFSITAAGYQTVISKLVAEQSALLKRASLRPLALGITISLPLSLICTGILYLFAEPISQFYLQEARTAPMLRILAFSIPFSATHACINGYFYGTKKAGIPASAQLFEQIIRVACVYLISGQSLAQGKTPTISVAVLGLTMGEICSMLFSFTAILCHRFKSKSLHSSRLISEPQTTHRSLANMQLPPNTHSSQTAKGTYIALLSMALPLTANRMVLNFLQSIESVSLPTALKNYGYDNLTALSVYGVLTGMAMPFIFFPNALTSSVSILLLPIISEKYALGDMDAVRKTALRTVKYCLFLGSIFMIFFRLTGQFLGTSVFDSPLAGYFISTLGLICPFLYLDTTLSGILQGLGMAGHIFVINIMGLLVRLGFVFLAVPSVGISGYLWGILAGQLTLGLLYLGCLFCFLHKPKNPQGRFRS